MQPSKQIAEAAAEHKQVVSSLNLNFSLQAWIFVINCFCGLPGATSAHDQGWVDLDFECSAISALSNWSLQKRLQLGKIDENPNESQPNNSAQV